LLLRRLADLADHLVVKEHAAGARGLSIEGAGLRFSDGKCAAKMEMLGF
jgi:hypothetical protein